MCGKFVDILKTEKVLSVNFSQFKVKISSVNVTNEENLCHTLSLLFNGPHGINLNGCDMLLCLMTSCGIILT